MKKEFDQAKYYDKIMKKFYAQLEVMNTEVAKATKQKQKESDKLSLFGLYLSWMEVVNQYEDRIKFTGRDKPHIYDSKIPKDYNIFIKLNPYEARTFSWEFRFSDKVIHYLRSIIQEYLIENFMKTVFKLARGDFRQATLYKSGPFTFMACFCKYISYKETLTFCILPERVPSVKNDKVIAYTYNQYIRFVDVVSRGKQPKYSFDNFFKTIVDHPDKFLSFQNGEYFSLLGCLNPGYKNPKAKDLNNVVFESEDPSNFFKVTIS